MIGNQAQSAPSTISVRGHPVHPMLMPFPISFLAGALVADLAYWVTRNACIAQVSFWLIGAGLGMGVVATLVGAVDFVTIGRARAHGDGWVHAGGNLLVLMLALVNLLLRLGNQEVPSFGLLVAATLVSAVTVALLVITTWYGGEMVYRHRVGIIGTGDGTPKS